MNSTLYLWKNTHIHTQKEHLSIQQILIEHLHEDKKKKKKQSPKPYHIERTIFDILYTYAVFSTSFLYFWIFD